MELKKPWQNRKIWAMKSFLGISEEELRDIVEQETGARSISRLSKGGANKVIDRLENYGVKPGQGAGYMQRQKIRLFSLNQLGWDNPARIAGFIRKMTGGRTDDIDDLSRKEANGIIEALKGMARREGMGVTG